MRYIFGGENYYIAIFPPVCQGPFMHLCGGEIYYIAIFPPVCQGPFMRGGNLLYSHFSTYPGK